MAGTKKKHTLYRIYYGDQIVYVGRTNQPLSTRIRGHLLAKPMQRKLNIDLITRIEYAVFESEADMNLYEIYYILMLHPPLNVDDKTRDFPTVRLPEVEFKKAEFKLWEKWRNDVKAADRAIKTRSERRREIQENLRILRSRWHTGELTEDEFYDEHDKLKKELDNIDREIAGGRITFHVV